MCSSDLFKEGKRALSLLHQLEISQLENIASKDPETFNALFPSLSKGQLIDLLNSPEKKITHSNIQTLGVPAIVSLSESPTASMAYPKKNYFDLIMQSLSADQLKELFENTDLFVGEDSNKVQDLNSEQLKELSERNPETFKSMVSLLSQKQVQYLPLW